MSSWFLLKMTKNKIHVYLQWTHNYLLLQWCYTRLWRMGSSGMLRHVALVRTDVSEEPSASFIRVTRIARCEECFAACDSCHKSHTALTSQKTPFFIPPWKLQILLHRTVFGYTFLPTFYYFLSYFCSHAKYFLQCSFSINQMGKVSL
jgi:hypothetical protein